MVKRSGALSEIIGGDVAEPLRTVFVGNPPYQSGEAAGGKVGAMPIYHKFVEHVLASGQGNEFVFVMPSRWFTGGRGLNHFRTRLTSSGEIAQIFDFPGSRAVFPSVEISGGVSFIHGIAGRKGFCAFTTRDTTVEVDLSKYNAVVREPIAYGILDKIMASHLDEFMDQTVCSVRAFGPTLRTDFRGFIPEQTGAVKCRSSLGVSWVPASSVDDKANIFHKWKVICSSADNGGNTIGPDGRKRVLSLVELLAPEEVCTETYMVIGTSDDRQTCENWMNYCKTKFARYLLGLKKVSQHITKEKYAWVPKMDFTRSWTDGELCAHFSLTTAETAHIEATIR
jgi:site-specific DNA-methyltransferase (adenine-specific)